MKFEYKSSNFISNPKENDKRIKIYDKNKTLKYSIEPEFDYAYLVNNCLFIKIVNKNDIKLSFENKNDAILSLNKLSKVKEFFIKDIPIISSKNTYSILNLNMPTLTTTLNAQLACNEPVKDIPSSMIRVYINGVDVNTGNPLKDTLSWCFFAPYSGLTYGQAMLMARDKGKEEKGDYLYWLGSYWEFGDKSGNGSGYELNNDLVDFVYLTSINNDIISDEIYSIKNINMNTTGTTNNGDIACLEPIRDIPESIVRVLVNDEEVIVGNPLSNLNSVCFFAPGGNSGIFALINAREIGHERVGDYLYWIGDEWVLDDDNIVTGSGFELLNTYSIDFIYTTKVN